MRKIIGGIVAAVVVVFGGYAFWNNHEQQEIAEMEKMNADKMAEQQAAIDAAAAAQAATPTGYKNGNYDVTVKYNTPAGPESLYVNLTLADNKVSAATVNNMGKDKVSINMQNKFIADFQKHTIGQDISALNLQVTSGSSLTTGGFNDALAKIRTQAKI